MRRRNNDADADTDEYADEYTDRFTLKHADSNSYGNFDRFADTDADWDVCK